MIDELRPTSKSHIFVFVRHQSSDKYKCGEDVYKCVFCGKVLSMRKGCVPSNNMKGCLRPSNPDGYLKSLVRNEKEKILLKKEKDLFYKACEQHSENESVKVPNQQNKGGEKDVFDINESEAIKELTTYFTNGEI